MILTKEELNGIERNLSHIVHYYGEYHIHVNGVDGCISAYRKARLFRSDAYKCEISIDDEDYTEIEVDNAEEVYLFLESLDKRIKEKEMVVALSSTDKKLKSIKDAILK